MNNFNHNTAVKSETDWLNSKPGINYIAFFFISIFMVLAGLTGLYLTIDSGLILWGINNKISWGIAVSNFIFWIGIAHSGTFISAILFLLNQSWRNEFNRIAELMTLIAIVIAAFFPWIHTGRPWFSSYWLFPYYNNLSLLPNFSSPLTWDLIAITTYFIVSAIFFYVGLFPDLYLLKNRIKNSSLSKAYSKLSFFWSDSDYQRTAFGTLYLILAGLATPLVVSVHTIVSYDFAVTFIKSWHSTIMPPYFVTGAVFSGLAMVNVIYIIFKYITKSTEQIDKSKLEKLNKLILFLSLTMSFFYLFDLFTMIVENRLIIHGNMFISGGYPVYIMLISNSIFPLLLLINKIRVHIIWSMIISVFILIGMWLERYLMVIQGQLFSDLSINNANYTPTIVDLSLLLGSIGIFLMLLLIFGRLIPFRSLREQGR